MSSILIFLIIPVLATESYYLKRTIYGDANEVTPDYINTYYGLSTYPEQQEFRRRPSFGLYPPQGLIRREHPFDFGPFGHRNFGNGNENVSGGERNMEKAKPGVWKQNGREAIKQMKQVIEERRREMKKRHEKIRKVLASERDQLREKFSDLHKRLVMKNKKMVEAKTSTQKPEDVTEIVPELSKDAQKLEKEVKNIMEDKKINMETKTEKLDELMVKAPESVKTELEAIGSSFASALPLESSPPVNYPSQRSFGSVVESRPIRISEDGQLIEF